MLEANPIVYSTVGKINTIHAGNQRRVAIEHIYNTMEMSALSSLYNESIEELPTQKKRLSEALAIWKNFLETRELPDAYFKCVDGWTDEQVDEFMIKANAHYGTWDTERLANEWDSALLEEWGVPAFMAAFEEEKNNSDDDGDKKHSLMVLFDDEFEMETLKSELLSKGYNCK